MEQCLQAIEPSGMLNEPSRMSQALSSHPGLFLCCVFLSVRVRKLTLLVCVYSTLFYLVKWVPVLGA